MTNINFYINENINKPHINSQEDNLEEKYEKAL